MSQDANKRDAAERALAHVEPGTVIGVGTGSTVKFFIEGLGRMPEPIRGAVSSSEQSTQQLRSLGIEVLDLNSVGPLDVYIDGADECDPHKRLIKGGGAGADARKDHRGGKSPVRLHDRPEQAGRPSRAFSAAG